MQKEIEENSSQARYDADEDPEQDPSPDPLHPDGSEVLEEVFHHGPYPKGIGFASFP
jgi:hypothetical protein